MSIKEKLDLRFLLPVFTSTIGIFIYLHFRIVEITTLEPANDYLLILSVCHYLSAICSILVFVVLTNEGLNYLNIDKRLIIPVLKSRESAQRNLLFFWPFLLVYSLASLVSISVFSSFDFETKQTLAITLSIIISILIIKFFLGIGIKLIAKMMSIISFKSIIVFFLGYLIFIPIEVLSSSGIIVESDKKIYKQTDVVNLLIKPKGYIFRPRIENVNYGLTFDTIKRGSDYVYYFDLKDYDSLTVPLVQTKYTLQIFESKYEHYFDLNVSPK
ncbi:hypothetical protein [Flavobacterium selenitireducens]|uniref:hypothetical protein n=1 Tax=Flavobacterium selenitireducens TaxID=2722704 RepID=UPI00168BF196|nr:hypothetical protein [Flavobacterium selenitireducens]MBD3584072.1 hypothetical protein [Flavobacterium selenitireducens]